VGGGLSAQPRLRNPQGGDDLLEFYVAHDEQIDVTLGGLLALRDRTEDERRPDQPFAEQ